VCGGLKGSIMDATGKNRNVGNVRDGWGDRECKIFNLNCRGLSNLKKNEELKNLN